MTRILEHALADARVLAEAGFDAVMMENFGDAPFHAGHVAPHTVAAMTRVGRALRNEIAIPLGINMLRNDSQSAIAVAAAVGASFVRVNVHCGVYATDQGIVEGRADETLRYRRRIQGGCEAGRGVAICADVMVKHARPLSTTSITEAAEETAYRGRADALIVSGSATGKPTAMEDVKAVRDAVPDRPLWIGSGANEQTVSDLLKVADGAIVGTAIKRDGVTTAAVDPDRARKLVELSR